MQEFKKITLIYDADVIASGIKENICRSGVYVTAVMILKELLKRKDINLVICCKGENIEEIKEYLAREQIFNFKYLNGYFSILIDKIKWKAKFPRTLSHQYKSIAWWSVWLAFTCFFKIFKSFIDKGRSVNECDCYLSTLYNMPKLLQNNEKIIKYSIGHDLMPLLFPQYYPGETWWKQRFEAFSHYFTDSEYSRSDFLKHLGHLKPQNVTTTLLACDESFKPASKEQIKAIKQKYNIPEHKKYIFSLCNLEPRKNLIRTVRTFIDFIKKHSIDDLVFVLGGAHWEKFIKELEKSINDLGSFKDKILKIGYVDDEDLAALYSGAEFFVYTSQYEGFGLPPLEAMSCGAAVITSDNSSLPEVVGDAGIMIPYDSDEAHIKAYEDYYFNPQLKEANAKKGLEQAKKFSWEKCVNIMVEKMKEDIEKASNNL